MNDLQKIEFNLFLCFDKICKELNLRYFLLCGSALGAVRHGGFIPWDDDLDVGMFRGDYNRFMEYAPHMLPQNIFLQNYKTDPDYPFVFAKLRNSETAFIEKALADFDINHGIYIDIFPLDGYPKEVSSQKKLASKKKNYRRKLYCGFDMPREFKSEMAALLLRCAGYHKRTEKTLEKYEDLISKYKVEDSDIICSHGNRHGERDYIPKEYYGKGIYMNFEGAEVLVPEKYDEYLSCLYGDWKVIPSVEKRETHLYKICDTEKSYRAYMKER